MPAAELSAAGRAGFSLSPSTKGGDEAQLQKTLLFRCGEVWGWSHDSRMKIELIGD